jgi:hypothetical protein
MRAGACFSQEITNNRGYLFKPALVCASLMVSSDRSIASSDIEAREVVLDFFATFRILDFLAARRFAI